MPLARRAAAAERDLQEIAFHLAVRNRQPKAADRIIDELLAQVKTLAEFAPTTVMGTAAPELGDGVRLYAFKRWVVLFRYAPHGIDVLRFADGSQDYLSWKLD